MTPDERASIKPVLAEAFLIQRRLIREWAARVDGARPSDVFLRDLAMIIACNAVLVDVRKHAEAAPGLTPDEVRTFIDQVLDETEADREAQEPSPAAFE